MPKLTIFDVVGKEVPPSVLRRCFCNHCGFLAPDGVTLSWVCPDCDNLNPPVEPDGIRREART